MKRYDSYKDSGVEWLGEIPNSWNIFRGKILFQNIVDKNHPNEPLLSVTQKDSVVKRSEMKNKVWNPNSDVTGYKLIKNGDFVISLRTFEGGVELSEIQGIVSPVYTVLRRRVNFFDRYFKYLLKSSTFITEINKVTTGIRQGKNISYDDFSEIKFPFPELNEQKKIGEYLDTKTSLIDSLIEKTQRKIELLKEKRTSLINEVVTKGLNPNVEMRDSGMDWIGEIPNGWEMKKIKFIFQEKKSTKNFQLNSGSISFGVVVYKDDEKIPESTKESYQELLKGEFLINPLNLNYDLKSLRIGMSRIDVVVSQGYIILILLDGFNEFYFEYLLRKFDVVYMKSLGQGVRQTISYNDIKVEPLVIPPLTEQQQIVEYLDKQTVLIDKTISIEEKRIELLKEYRQSLISEVITGKIRVSKVDNSLRLNSQNI